MGAGDWSVAVGEDWQRRESNALLEYALSLGNERAALLSVGSDPRLRGTVDDAYDDFIAALRGEYADSGLVLVAQRSVTVSGLAGRELDVRPLYAGRRVMTITRAMVQRRHIGQVWCTAPVERAATAREHCRRITATLTLGDVPREAPGTRVIRRGDEAANTAVRIPDDWLDPPTPAEGTITVRSDRTPDAITVELDVADLDGTERAYFNRVAQTLVEDGVTRLVSQRRGHDRARRWVDVEVARDTPVPTAFAQRLVIRGDRIYGFSCVEPALERSAGRDHCTPVLDSFRFGEP